MYLRVGMMMIVALTFASPAAAGAYTAKVESSDEEYVTKRSAEAAEQQAEARHKEEEQSRAASGASKAEEEKGQQESTSSGPTGSKGSVRCVVPSLVGESLRGARIALSRHHCRLGNVLKPHGRHRGSLVVVDQRIPAGKALDDEARIGVRLGLKAAHGRKGA